MVMLKDCKLQRCLSVVRYLRRQFVCAHNYAQLNGFHRGLDRGPWYQVKARKYLPINGQQNQWPPHTETIHFE